MTSKPAYHLYTFFASGAAERVRIACNLKNIPLTFHYVNLQTREHGGDTYREVNPGAAIPTLVVETTDDTTGESIKFSIHQSVAILEYLEEHEPVCARVRKVRDSADDESAFANSVFDEGFSVYEKMLEKFSKGKKYAAGDEVTLADACLMPQVQQARLRKVDFEKWPLLRGLIERLESLEGFKKATWNRQDVLSGSF
ncbi:glutathione S-transferase [Massarina eburnea CBS 473.64]|uniref:Glutathione S-transferase n=1 Tax=Massarina eburnea CBS 473.64 TaxID=1395130 RepID=A0A6A6RQZ2_9PLEO|nr:glutathione S-transferase [Massarina eburnea CBS 473.64]